MAAVSKVTADARKARAVALIDIHAKYANGYVNFVSESYSVHRYWRVEIDKSAHIQEYLIKTQQQVLDRCVAKNDFYAKQVWEW